MDSSKGILRDMLDSVQFNNDQISARVIDYKKEDQRGMDKDPSDLKAFVQEY